MGHPTTNASSFPSPSASTQLRSLLMEDRLESLSLGVYHVFVVKNWKCSVDFLDRGTQALKNWIRHLSLAMRLLTELASFNRNLLILYVILGSCLQMEATALLSVEVHLMRTIEAGLRDHSIDTVAVVKGLILRAFVVVVFSMAGRSGERIGRNFQVGVKYYYEEVLLRDKLVDVVNLDDNDDALRDGEITSDIPWRAFHQIFCLWGFLVEFLGSVTFLSNIIRHENHGLILVLLCLVPTLLEFLLSLKNMWTIPRVTQAVNPHYLRMRSLLNLAQKKYRYDILCGNASQYIYQEFKKARHALGYVSLDTPENIYRRDNVSWAVTALKDIAGDFTMMYHASLAIFVSHRASMALFTAIRHVAPTLLPCFSSIFHRADEITQSLSQLQDMYNVQTRRSLRKVNGHLHYPDASENLSSGMGLELRNVTFSYPGAPDQTVLDRVSAKISPGQLVVVVGTNGSGKSTLINLLARMHDPKHGQILIDGIDLKRFEIQSFRDAITVLTQGHLLYGGLSIGENIAIGRPELMMDEEEIADAARKSDADKVIAKFGGKGISGLGTIIDPYREQALRQVDTKNQKHPLNKLWKKLEKGRDVDVSGGERQRLVAQVFMFFQLRSQGLKSKYSARAFMRMKDPRVKLVLVDEPTSALDPEAERHLLTNLLEARRGKTMVFVTHRFGHLTKHADLILCMKDGNIVERGKHDDLMSLRGVYQGLFVAASSLTDSGVKASE